MTKLTHLVSAKTLTYLMSILFVCTIPFPIKFHNAAVGLLLLLCITAINWKDVVNSKWKFEKLYVLFALQFVIIAIGLLHSTNVEAGLNDLERGLYPLATIPIVYVLRSSNILLDRMLLFFSISCILLAMYGLSYSWILSDAISFNEAFRQGSRNFIVYTGIQPLYISVYLVLVLFFLLESIRTKYEKLTAAGKWGLAGASLLVILLVVFLRSKTALLLLPTLLIIYLVIVQKKRGWLVIFLLMMVGLLTFLLDKNNSPNLIDEYGAVSKAFDQRIFIWKGAIEGIKTSPLIGAGTGGTQELLNVGYKSIGYEEGVVNEFNAHNQYLQFMARNGLLELIVFLTILGYCFWHSAKESNYTFLMFNILVAFVMITESFLSVQKGIVFFYFFSLAFTYLGNQKSAEAKML